MNIFQVMANNHDTRIKINIKLNYNNWISITLYHKFEAFTTFFDVNKNHKINMLDFMMYFRC